MRVDVAAIRRNFDFYNAFVERLQAFWVDQLAVVEVNIAVAIPAVAVASIYEILATSVLPAHLMLLTL